MSSTNNKIINIFILAFSLFLVMFLLLSTDTFEKVEEDKTNNNVIIKEINISEIISKYNEQNIVVSQIYNNDFVSLITVNEKQNHETLLIDVKTGEEMPFEDIILDEYSKDFWNKVYDLLSLKYPKFIIEGLKTSEGNIYYEIKDNEMVVYFENFSFSEEYHEIISIKVNYNEIHNFLNFPVKLDSDYENESAYHYDKSKKTIALTFDDGPNGKYTKKIVDVLKDNKAKATFFMVGNKMNSYKDTLLYVYENGFEIGSHTYSHINMKKETIGKVKDEIKKTRNIYNKITGSNLTLVRPPYGAYNENVLKNISYPLITWNIDTNDWRYHDVSYIVEHIMSNASDGSIILMHDAYETSLEALKVVLPKLYAKGYQVVTVSDLVAIKGAKLENNHVYSYFK